MYNHQLDAFIKTADLGSFAKAAEALYISPPAVIQQVNLLENRCGFKLFIRSNHGIRLTPAGQSLYTDAKTLIRFSEHALDKARLLAQSGENTVRIGTSLLFKCRTLTRFLPDVMDRHPELKFEILPMTEYLSRGETFAQLGVKYDLFEGTYCSIGWKGLCQFLELERSPLCCAVSKQHPFAQRKRITLDDLENRTVVMPIADASDGMDALRRELREKRSATIIDSPYYGVDTFAMCEFHQYILITQPQYADIHPNLVTIPLNSPYELPYGIMYANEPSATVQLFIETIRDLKHNYHN